jgi:hypothetical protein
MKLIILECTEDELRANRGIMDAIVDACHGFINTFYGTCTPSMAKENEEEDEGEDGGTE